MSEMRRCFAALGFTETPTSAVDVMERFAKERSKLDNGTESGRLARKLLQENCELCLAELRKT